MSVQQQVAALERLAGDADGQELPSIVYFTGCTSTASTPDKHTAFKQYKEQWQDDSRYKQLLSTMQSFNDLESYLTAHGLTSYLVQVAFVGGEPTEQAR